MDLLVQLALPRDAVVLEVAQLVVEPVEALAHHGLLVEGVAEPLVGRRRRARPEQPERVAHGEADQHGDEDGQDLHAPSMTATTDNDGGRGASRRTVVEVPRARDERGASGRTVVEVPRARDERGASRPGDVCSPGLATP